MYSCTQFHCQLDNALQYTKKESAQLLSDLCKAREERNVYSLRLLDSQAAAAYHERDALHWRLRAEEAERALCAVGASAATATVVVVDSAILDRLYKGRPHKCHECGLRFATPKQKEAHVFQHYKPDKAPRSQAASRSYFTTAMDWIMDNGAEMPISVFVKEVVPATENKPKACTVVVHEIASICASCGAAFVTQWDHDQEEWVFVHCVLLDRRPYHPECADGVRPVKRAYYGQHVVAGYNKEK